jgi:putative DNA methylase
VCEKKKRSQEALAYNALVLGWPEIARLARGAKAQVFQAELFNQE